MGLLLILIKLYATSKRWSVKALENEMPVSFFKWNLGKSDYGLFV